MRNDKIKMLMIHVREHLFKRECQIPGKSEHSVASQNSTEDFKAQNRRSNRRGGGGGGFSGPKDKSDTDGQPYLTMPYTS